MLSDGAELSKTTPSKGAFQRLKSLLGMKNSSSFKESLEEVIEEHESAGEVIDREEKLMLKNVLTFNELSVEDVMIPRADIVAVEHEIEFQELKDIMLKKVHTRLPVYRETLDDIVGFIHIKDLVSVLCESDAFNIDHILRKALFVPPSMRISALLLKMQVTRVHIALVVDEFGGTCGMLTMEDLMEEIVGEIEDEHDSANEGFVYSHGGNIIEVSARLPLDELESLLHIALCKEWEDEDFDTVGGLVFYLSGRVPVVGEVIDYQKIAEDDTGWTLEFEVLEADPRRIKKLLIRYASGVNAEGAHEIEDA